MPVEASAEDRTAEPANRESELDVIKRASQRHSKTDDRRPEDKHEAEFQALQVDGGPFAGPRGDGMTRILEPSGLSFAHRGCGRRGGSRGRQHGLQCRGDGRVRQNERDFWRDVDETRGALVLRIDDRAFEGKVVRHAGNREIGGVCTMLWVLGVESEAAMSRALSGVGLVLKELTRTD